VKHRTSRSSTGQPPSCYAWTRRSALGSRASWPTW